MAAADLPVFACQQCHTVLRVGEPPPCDADGPRGDGSFVLLGGRWGAGKLWGWDAGDWA